MPDHDRLLSRRNALAVALGRPAVPWPTYGERRYPSAWFPCARCDATIRCRSNDVDVGLLCRACRDELIVGGGGPA